MSKIYLTSPKKHIKTEPLPMIYFKQISNEINFDGIDTLMFTSKQAVVTTDNITKKWKEFESIVIGSATEKMVLNLGGKVLFKPKKFYGKSLALNIVNKFKDRNIIYLRPEKVIFNSREFLIKYGINLREQIIYKTECKNYPNYKKPLKNSIIIFTSPSTIHCFLKNFDWDSSYRAVVIGESTKEHLPKNSRYRVAKEPTIDATIELALEWSLI